MPTKKEVLKTLQSLPDKFDVEEAIKRIVLLETNRLGWTQSQKEVVSRKVKKSK